MFILILWNIFENRMIKKTNGNNPDDGLWLCDGWMEYKVRHLRQPHSWTIADGRQSIEKKRGHKLLGTQAIDWLNINWFDWVKIYKKSFLLNLYFPNFVTSLFNKVSHIVHVNAYWVAAHAITFWLLLFPQCWDHFGKIKSSNTTMCVCVCVRSNPSLVTRQHRSHV